MRMYIVKISSPQMSVKDSYEVYAKSPVTAINRVLKEQDKKYENLSQLNISVHVFDWE